MSRKSRWIGAVGLALLYASGFYLPLAGSYYLPYEDSQILYPSAVAVLLISPLAASFLARYGEGNRSDLFGGIVISLLCWMAIVSMFSAAGYSALDAAVILSGTPVLGEATRWIRLVLVVTGLSVSIIGVHFMRRHWRSILRLLTILGYTYASLAALRIDHLPQLVSASSRVQSRITSVAPRSDAEVAQSSMNALPKPRQVIWIIFDEMDYNDTLGRPNEQQNSAMPNLERLAQAGVSASNAYSPAKDTVASIPMLLTGYPSVGQDIRDGALRLKTRSAGLRIFQESDTIFGRLPEGPDSAAMLGFYHPYCHLFPSVTNCVAQPYLNAGRWFDALAYFGHQAIETARFLPASSEYLPGALFRWFEPMYRITEDTVSEFPRMLSLEDKSLVFIHVNLPHLPGDYSQRWLHVRTVGDDRDVYQRNLRLVDDLVGQTVTMLRARASRQEILLVVSSDHWFRVESPLTVQRIPWIAWHVGETDGIRLETRISTIHTGDLALSFLRGSIVNHAQIAAWWRDKPFYPTLMPNGFTY